MRTSLSKALDEIKASEATADTVSSILLKAMNFDAQNCLARVKGASLGLGLITSNSSELEQLAALEKSLSDFLQELTAFTSCCSDSGSLLTLLCSRLIQFSQTITELETRVNDSVRESNQKQYEALTQTCSEAKLEIARLTEECAQKADKELLLEQTVSKLTADLDVLRSTALTRTDELASAQSALETMQQRLSVTEKQLEESQVNRNQRESVVQEKEAQITHLEAQLTRTSDSTAEKQSQVGIYHHY